MDPGRPGEGSLSQVPRNPGLEVHCSWQQGEAGSSTAGFTGREGGVFGMK